MRRVFLALFIVALAAAAAVLFWHKPAKKAEGPLGFYVVKYFPFSDAGSLKEWKDKVFKGKVLYNIKTEGAESFVMAASDSTASAFYYKIKLDMDKRPVISWKWSVKKFPKKGGPEDLRDAKSDDFAARVYIIFSSLFFTGTKALEYIWAEKLEEGTVASSPYSRNLKLIVVQSGEKEDGEWVLEERDIYKDYIDAFSEEPKSDIGAIAFMTDSDSTRSSAVAHYDEIKIGYEKEGGDKKR